MSFHVYDPAAGHRLAHDPLNAIVAPRPIGWIGSRDAAGRANLAPYSFFNLFNYKPPILGFCSLGWKDSVRNVAETGAFTWNLCTEDLAQAMNASSAAVPPETDEFALAGLTALAGEAVAAPRVGESPVSFECRLTQMVRLTDAAGVEIEAWLALGQAVRIHIDERLIADGVFDTVAARPLLRGGGAADYFTISAAAKRVMHRPG